MAKGDEYTLYKAVKIYWDSDGALSGTGSTSTIGPGTYYYWINNTNIPTGREYAPAIPLCHPNVYLLGWINENDNLSGSTLTSFSNFTVRSGASTTYDFKLNFKINKSSPGTYHYVSFYVNDVFIADWSGSGSASDAGLNSGGSKTWTMNETNRKKILNAMKNTKTATARLYLNTYRSNSFGDSTRISRVSRTSTATVSIYETPTISNVQVATSTSRNISSALNSLVKNKGVLTYSFNSSASYGASIKSTIVTFSGKTLYTNSGSFVPDKSGSQTFKIIVKDSRGQSKEYTTSKTVLDYTPPTLKILFAGRPRSGNYSDTQLEVQPSLKVNSVLYNGTDECNRYRLTFKTKRYSSSESWKTVKTTSITDPNTTSASHFLSNGSDENGYRVDKSYDIEVTLTDEFQTLKATARAGTVSYLMAFGPKGVGFGKLPEYSRPIDVTGDIYDRNGRNLSWTVSSIKENYELISLYNDTYWNKAGTFSYRAIKVNPAARVVYINFAYDAGSDVSTSKWLIQLPSAYRPSLKRFIPWSSKRGAGLCEMNTNGELTAYIPDGMTNRYFYVSGIILY